MRVNIELLDQAKKERQRHQGEEKTAPYITLVNDFFRDVVEEIREVLTTPTHASATTKNKGEEFSAQSPPRWVRPTERELITDALNAGYELLKERR